MGRQKAADIVLAFGKGADEGDGWGDEADDFGAPEREREPARPARAEAQALIDRAEGTLQELRSVLAEMD